MVVAASSALVPCLVLAGVILVAAVAVLAVCFANSAVRLAVLGASRAGPWLAGCCVLVR